ncbi:A/G-specific adenine DNA glycosylase [Trichinella pseudospiralis]|uniref:Adenine DNA glycosylase n=1 Tax=Trichinella pseudospiralis TaxID=6337 RepID=A0A0V1EKI3_TRIPS|nr:A/G-specific adenine DNA glycosylase [Trichinella pseudospiralis]KRZ32923.1 A/G-specific adenine DNA glycosylase [Trichinella pseudospiralis]
MKIAKEEMNICKIHFFDENVMPSLSDILLSWYERNCRPLPWRRLAKNPVLDLNTKAYYVWVSEIMCQQTQVATVKDYFERWIEKWPSVVDLAETSLEEVNKIWAGLGYYSRAKNLYEAAKIICLSKNGKIPQTAEELEKLPGVGRYTACAISSIAFGERKATVDGNIQRVLSRMLCVGENPTSRIVKDHLWKVADNAICSDRPGDFNQALMEIGSLICTPKNPDCSSCPINIFCNAYKKVQDGNLALLADIEDDPKCFLCLPHSSPWQNELGVQNYPGRKVKKPSKKENKTVIFMSRSVDNKFLCIKRLDSGLLSGLWEILVIDGVIAEKHLPESVENKFKLKMIGTLNFCGTIFHKFSHIDCTYHISCCKVRQLRSKAGGSESNCLVQWMDLDTFEKADCGKIQKYVKCNMQFEMIILLVARQFAVAMLHRVADRRRPFKNPLFRATVYLVFGVGGGLYIVWPYIRYRNEKLQIDQ